MPRSPEFYDPVRCRSVAVPRVEASRELGPTKPVVHPSAHFVSEGHSAGQPARTPPKKPYRLNSPIWTPAPPAPTAQLSQGVIRPILRTPTVVISTPPISNTRKPSARPSPYAHYHFDLRVARSLPLNYPPLASSAAPCHTCHRNLRTVHLQGHEALTRATAPAPAPARASDSDEGAVCDATRAWLLRNASRAHGVLERQESPKDAVFAASEGAKTLAATSRGANLAAHLADSSAAASELASFAITVRIVFKPISEKTVTSSGGGRRGTRSVAVRLSAMSATRDQLVPRCMRALALELRAPPGRFQPSDLHHIRIEEPDVSTGHNATRESIVVRISASSLCERQRLLAALAGVCERGTLPRAQSFESLRILELPSDPVDFQHGCPTESLQPLSDAAGATPIAPLTASALVAVEERRSEWPLGARAKPAGNFHQMLAMMGYSMKPNEGTDYLLGLAFKGSRTEALMFDYKMLLPKRQPWRNRTNISQLLGSATKALSQAFTRLGRSRARRLEARTVESEPLRGFCLGEAGICSAMVTHPAMEFGIFLLIVSSSVLLVLDDPLCEGLTANRSPCASFLDCEVCPSPNVPCLRPSSAHHVVRLVP